MATYRQVHLSFWQDGFILSVTPDEKFFYLYLLTNSKTKQCGVYELPLKVIEMETGFPSDKVFDFIHKFVGYKKILYNEETREVMILNWIKHNSINSPKVKACVLKELREIKHLPYVNRFYEQCNRYGYTIDRLSIDSGEEEEKEEEKEEEYKGNDSQKIVDYCNKLKVQLKGVYDLDRVTSFIGCMDTELILEAVKRSEGKNGSYVVTILEDWNNKKFKSADDVKPKDKPTNKVDPQIIARRREIEFQRWIESGGIPNEFIYKEPTGA